MASSLTKEDLLAVFAEVNEQQQFSFPLSELALKRLFTKGVYSRAQQMLRDEQVLWVKANDDYTQIDAQVMDDDGTTYDQQIRLNVTAQVVDVEAHCSCDAKVRCKHVASALLQLKLQSQGDYAHQYRIEDWFNEIKSDGSASDVQNHGIAFELHPHHQQLTLTAKIAALNEDNEYTQGRALTEQQSHAQVTPKGVCEQDFRLFSWIRSQNQPGKLTLHSQWGERALLQLLSNAQLFFEKERQPLQLGKPIALSYQWQVKKDIAQLRANYPNFNAERVLPTSPPYYVNTAEHQVHALQTHLSAEQIQALARFPQAEASEVDELAKRLMKTLHLRTLVNQKKKLTPYFNLQFLTAQVPYKVRLVAKEKTPAVTVLQNLGLQPCKAPLQDEYIFIPRSRLHQQQWLFELNSHVQALGGTVTGLPKADVKNTTSARIIAQVNALHGHRLEVQFVINHRAKDYPLTLAQMQSVPAYTTQHYFIAVEERYFTISAATAECIRQYLARFARGKHQPHCTLPRSLYQQLQQEQSFELRVDSQLQKLLAPATLKSLKKPQLHHSVTLREYQHSGVNWLQLLAAQGLGGVLADDMGLGKTLQVIAFLSTLENTQKPHLVLCPTSLVANWYNEIQRFCPHMEVDVVIGHNRTAQLQQLNCKNVIVTTYTLFKRDFAFYHGVQFNTVVLDEAQAIKNAQSQLSIKAKQLQAQTRIALSGTPFENNLQELKSVFDFALPGLLGSDAQFKSNFLEATDGLVALQEAIRPYLLRRAKADVLCELPSKTELVKQLDMLPAQAQVYHNYHRALHDKLAHLVAHQGVGKSKLQFLDALLKLRQICCHPQLVDDAHEASSAKLQWLATHLPHMLAQDHHVIIFSQFTSMLRLIAKQLTDLEIDYAMLTGQTRDRQHQVDEFQQGHKRVFLVSLKAGGSGLNLTRADTVIHFDPWWNPAVEHQATDRAYRMGQDRSVFVYKLIIADSVEQQVMSLADKKRHLVDEFLNTSLLADKKIDDNQLLEMLNLQNEEKA
ncbi:helicase [Pseudoalteromonas ruthenica]|uniref:DEAD/DEAH box helicase n=1 Tax=Pseudoalteromonas ruthenica TaxID=151081 RepID=UPI001109604C|nr:DEAD/DEAH box helicase [Pseudoalteromonas ruthenica]TLX51773.1 helicase [Pseudoalteromonas ruthenica]